MAIGSRRSVNDFPALRALWDLGSNLLTIGAAILGILGMLNGSLAWVLFAVCVIVIAAGAGETGLGLLLWLARKVTRPRRVRTDEETPDAG